MVLRPRGGARRSRDTVRSQDDVRSPLWCRGSAEELTGREAYYGQIAVLCVFVSCRTYMHSFYKLDFLCVADQAYLLAVYSLQLAL